MPDGRKLHTPALLERRDHLPSLRVRQFRYQLVEPLLKLAVLLGDLLPDQHIKDADYAT